MSASCCTSPRPSSSSASPSLTAWLRQRITDADRDGADEDRTLRLDSDAEAVQVLTIHRSKGLEFPIVYHPFAWQPGYIDQNEPPAYHDDQNDDAWTIDVGGDGPDIARHRRLRDLEQRGEDLRLLYVALTRTMHQATVWWAGSYECRNSSLGRLLFARDADGVVAAEVTDTPDDDEVVARLAELSEAAPGRISVERVEAPAGTRWAGEPRPTARARSGALRSHTRRALATRLLQQHRLRRREEPVATRARGRASSTTSRLPAATADDATSSTDTEEQRLRAALAPLAAMPGGADVGDLLHRVLEATDFAADDLETELAARLAEQRRRRDIEIGDADTVIAGLAGAIETPLGPLLGEIRLRDVAAADRLDELDFELPLVGGDTPTGTLALCDRRLAARDAPARRRPARRLRRTAARPARALGSARLPDRDTRPRRPLPAARTARPLRPRRLQEQLARCRRRGPQRLALPAGRTRRGDAARALPAASAALRRRAAPLPARPAPRLRRRTSTSPASSTCSCAV